MRERCGRRRGCGLVNMISRDAKEMGLGCHIGHTLAFLACFKAGCAGREAHELAQRRRAREAHWSKEGHEGRGGSHVELYWMVGRHT